MFWFFVFFFKLCLQICIFFSNKSLMKFFLFLLFYNKIYIDKEWTRGEQKTQKTD